MSTQDPTISKRSQELRRRHKADGDKSYLLWLSPTSQARLARLKQEGETLAQLVDRALEALEGVANPVANQRETVANSVAKLTQEDRQRVEVWVPEDLVDSLRAFLLGGVAKSVAKPVAQQRESVAEYVAKQQGTGNTKALSAEELARIAQSLHNQGLSYAQIAERWEKEKVPTLKGGRWHKGTIGKLVQRYSQ